MHKILGSLTAVVAGALFAQQTSDSARFEVASVRQAVSKGGPGDIPRNMDTSPGHFAMRNVPLRYCLEWAYSLDDYQIVGPDWIKNDERYDIAANAPGPASDEQMKPMLQALLTERFRIKQHRETRELRFMSWFQAKGRLR